MINLLLYTGLGLATVAISGLAYGLIMNKARQHTLINDKTIKHEPNITEY